MKIAIITLDAFNELDSFIASAIFGRVQKADWVVQICCPTETVTSMNGVKITAQQPLSYANDADIVLFGSGMKTADYANDPEFLSQFSLDPNRQLIGSQCSGALILHQLGLLQGKVSTDTMTAPSLIAKDLTIVEEPLHVTGNIATAGGCLASHYLAGWAIARKTDWQTAEDIIHYIAPVGQKDEFARRAKAVVSSHLPT